jgi:hypothetical protein
VLQLRLHGDARAVHDAWACVGKAIGGSGVLELVQASGETLLVGGPFRRGTSEADHVAAARQVLVFVRELAGVLRSTGCTFTAVATTGTAYSALLGAANLTYRLFGAAVRENNAIMAAAPPPLGQPRNIAFAANSFRQQERNFAVRKVAVIQDAAMSTALAASCAEPPESAASAAHVSGAAEAFGQAMLWRAAGLGMASVSVVRLSAE